MTLARLTTCVVPALFLAAPASAAPPVVTGDPVYISEDGRFRIDPLFLTQHDIAWSTGERQGKENSDYNLRRQRIGVSGFLFKDFLYQFDFEQSNHTTQLRDDFVAYQGVPHWYFAAGQMREASGLIEHAPSMWLPFLERGMGVTTQQALRNIGLKAVHHDSGHSVELGLARGSSGQAGDEDGGWSGSARLVLRPVYAPDEDRILHLGVNGRYRGPDEPIRFRTSGEQTALSSPLIDTGTIRNVEHYESLAGEAYYTDGPFSLLAEMRGTRVERKGGGNPLFYGGYAQAGYFLTGEQRNYLPVLSTFFRLVPKRTVWEGGPGAWEVAARYDRLELSDEGIRGGELQSTTLGLNWYPDDFLKVMANYVVNDVKDRPGAQEPDIFVTRLQFTF